MKKYIILFLLLAFVPTEGYCLSQVMMDYDRCVSVYGGSGTCTDRVIQYYRGLGYTGTIYDMEMEFLGDAGYTGTLWDRWKAYLGAQGMTGTLRDRFAGAWSLSTTASNIWTDDNSFNWVDDGTYAWVDN